MAAKTYRVSLACMVPHNFESEVQAETELEAFKKGVEAFDAGTEGEIVEVLPADTTLNLGDYDEDEIPVGAWIEEIKP